jgi:hypothetical protein
MKIELNIQSKKLELIQWLSTIEDLSVINANQGLKISIINAAAIFP